MTDAEIAKSAGGVAALYWELAEELRAAAVTLSTAIDAGSALPVVGRSRLAAAIMAGMALQRIADDRG
jgi:hypothetical protein